MIHLDALIRIAVSVVVQSGVASFILPVTVLTLVSDKSYWFGFGQRPDWGGASSTTSTPAMKDCILLAACAANEILPQNAELPADVFTSCLTTPIKIALRW